MTTVYYHGGIGGLKPGDLILPPSVTGVKTFGGVCEEMSSRFGLFNTLPFRLPTRVRDDLVYVTPDFSGAFEYAWTYTVLPMLPGHGSVYRVAPSGTLAVDDTAPAAFTCREARVESVEIEHAEAPEGNSVYLRAVNMFAVIYAGYLRLQASER